jgi:hypothetical protein
VILLTLQQNTILFSNQCLGGMKCALNMVVNNFNNFCISLFSLSAGGDCI